MLADVGLAQEQPDGRTHLSMVQVSAAQRCYCATALNAHAHLHGPYDCMTAPLSLTAVIKGLCTTVVGTTGLIDSDY